MSPIAYLPPSCCYSQRTHMWGICIKTSCDSDKVWEEFTWNNVLGFLGKSSSLACLWQAWPPVLWGPALGVMSWPHPSLLLNLVLISTLRAPEQQTDSASSLCSADIQPKLTLYSLQWLRSSCPLCPWIPVYGYGILALPWKQAKLKVSGGEWGCPTMFAFHEERGLE